MSWLFTLGGQSIVVSASINTTFYTINTVIFPLGKYDQIIIQLRSSKVCQKKKKKKKSHKTQERIKQILSCSIWNSVIKPFLVSRLISCFFPPNTKYCTSASKHLFFFITLYFFHSSKPLNCLFLYFPEIPSSNVHNDGLTNGVQHIFQI